MLPSQSCKETVLLLDICALTSRDEIRIRNPNECTEKHKEITQEHFEVI